MTPVLFFFIFNFIIYSSCDKALKNGKVKSKIVYKSSFGDMIFLTLHDYILLLLLLLLLLTNIYTGQIPQS